MDRRIDRQPQVDRGIALYNDMPDELMRKYASFDKGHFGEMKSGSFE